MLAAETEKDAELWNLKKKLQIEYLTIQSISWTKVLSSGVTE